MIFWDIEASLPTPSSLVILGAKARYNPQYVIPTGGEDQLGFGFINPSSGSGTVISAVDQSGYGGQIKFSYNEGKVFVRISHGSFGSWREI